MSAILFYLMYAGRNLWRNRRWSAFAIFSVAAGVAAVVALRSLGLSIGDSLTENIRSNNKGDITLEFVSNGSGLFSGNNDLDRNTFTPPMQRAVDTWVEDQDGKMTPFTFVYGMQITALDPVSIGVPQLINSFLIDPAEYPLTQDVFAVDPAGVPLGELFTGGNEVVISQNLADAQKLQVGDSVRVSGTEEQFIVRGIVATEVQAGLRQFASNEILSVLFGFAYFDVNTAVDLLAVPTNPNRINITLPDNTPLEDIEARAEEINEIANDFTSSYIEVTSVPQLLRQNEMISDVLGRFIVVMGLGAMLIGGIGIINTMLVMVRRRTEEIAALKTFGLKGRQVAGLFMAEAFLLGVFGSLLGAVFGVLMSGVANDFGATFVQQSLPWRIYPEAILFGLVLGLTVSVIFGVLPVITAARIRPAIILRPNETHIPAAGALQSLFALLFVVIALGLIAGQIIGNVFIGLIGVAVTLALLGVLVMLLWVLVWVIGKLPTFGWVDLKLAFRNLSTRRLRTATTLLALSGGMFALSSITFFGASTRDILNFTLTQTLGGNILVIPVLPANLANPMIDGRLDALPGVEYRSRYATAGAEVISVDDKPISSNTLTAEEIEAIEEQIDAALFAGDFNLAAELSQQLPVSRYLSMTSVETTNVNPDTSDIIDGRALTADDYGQPVAVVRVGDVFEGADVRVGSKIRLQLVDRSQFSRGGMGAGRNQGNAPRSSDTDSGEFLTVEVVGLLRPNDGMGMQTMGMEGNFRIPSGLVESGSGFSLQMTLVQTQPEHTNEVLVSLTALPLVFALDISFFDTVLSRLIQQFSALPILVGLLSLLAAAVIMANTVALSTLERRRQIGILKAIGLKGNRVLGVMLLENVFISVLGGVLGIGLSALGVYLITALGLDNALLIPDDALPVAIALIFASGVIGAVATLLSASVAVRERVLNVLRYE